MYNHIISSHFQMIEIHAKKNVGEMGVVTTLR